MRTVSISSFAQRHSAFHWSAVFDESFNVGKFGLETADEVYAIAEIGSNGKANKAIGSCTFTCGIHIRLIELPRIGVKGLLMTLFLNGIQKR